MSRINSFLEIFFFYVFELSFQVTKTLWNQACVVIYVIDYAAIGSFLWEWLFWNIPQDSWELPVQESYFNKAAGLQPTILLKRRLQYRCFAVNISKFFTTVLFENTIAQKARLCFSRMNPNYILSLVQIPKSNKMAVCCIPFNQNSVKMFYLNINVAFARVAMLSIA